MSGKEILKEKLYAQGCPSTPVHVMSAAGSGFVIKELIGDKFTGFVFINKDDYSKMHYLVRDLERLGKILLAKLEKDPDFFLKAKKIYDNNLEKSRELYRKIDSLDLRKLDDKNFYALIKPTAKTIETAVGVGHVIEPFVLTTDIKIKHELSGYVKNPKELNSIFVLLVAPVKKSFVNESEEMLSQIAKTKDKALLKKYLERFGWIRNSYAGKYYMTEKEILEQSESLKGKEPFDSEKIKKEKKRIIEELKLPEDLVVKIKATEFITSWQDERKKEILIGIDYLEKMLKELSRRVNIDINYLRYALVEELTPDIKNMKDMLKQRRNGSVIIYYKEKSIVLTGKDYEDAVNQIEKEQTSEIKEISGLTASVGTAIGPVKVCTDIKSIHKVQKGDILVASMTRPEHVPAMKKAAAIITDEGGITCHAAIISRELGIPCIIGTKIATKVLKDGDLVEVKGNHGLVIILK